MRKAPVRASATSLALPVNETYCGRWTASCCPGRPTVCRCYSLCPKSRAPRQRSVRPRKIASDYGMFCPSMPPRFVVIHHPKKSRAKKAAKKTVKAAAKKPANKPSKKNAAKKWKSPAKKPSVKKTSGKKAARKTKAKKSKR
jgi:hypothetical protein